MSRPTITFVVDDKSGKVLYKEIMSAKSALKAIKWLELHNGHAPDEVHSLIRGMKIAVKAAK